MAFCRVINGRVAEVWQAIELPPLHPDAAAQYVECAPDVEMGWSEDGAGGFIPYAPTQAELNAARTAEIMARLSEIDLLSVRALRAKSIGRGQAQDDSTLTALEDEADALRLELSGL